MDKGQKKARKRVIVIFVVYLCIALAFLGIAAYFIMQKRAGGDVSDRIVKVTQILVLASVFFLVLDFGFILPSLLSHNKICNEVNMRQALSKYLPHGETLMAGIYATVQESKIITVFKNCRCIEGKLIPDENAGVLSLVKGKYAEYSVYLGITQSDLLIVECEKNKHYYEYSNEPDVQNMDVQKLGSELDWNDIGIVFSLEDVQNCDVKKGRMGSVLCTLTMKNGTYFKLSLPETAGPNGDMPHHTEYREAILTRLGEKI